MRVKKAERVGKDQIKVTLEEQGREFTFMGDAWELFNEERRLSILAHWRDVVIPSRLAVEKMSDEEFERKLKKLEEVTI